MCVCVCPCPERRGLQFVQHRESEPLLLPLYCQMEDVVRFHFGNPRVDEPDKRVNESKTLLGFYFCLFFLNDFFMHIRVVLALKLHFKGGSLCLVLFPVSFTQTRHVGTITALYRGTGEWDGDLVVYATVESDGVWGSLSSVFKCVYVIR